ncbi:MAG: FAD-dependent thymidylate synthase [Anaerolineae bacterium]|nr:FAD-dependent thymidylate synthase [Anaerolineae bacterium]MDW8099497.1 FAD-dependent thymidylate synthase [Anaerolineae bacterium]
MNVRLLSCTRLNPALSAVDDLGDVRMMLEATAGTEQERLAEFAARVCYRSTDKMGHNPGFLQSRLREGHEDVIEHVTFVVFVSGTGLAEPADVSPRRDEPIWWRMANRHLEVTPWRDGWVVSGNARVWLDLFRRGLALDVLPVVQPLAPALYAEFNRLEVSG